MRIGKKIKEVEDVPRPIPLQPIRKPERDPVSVPTRKEPVKVPDKKAWGRVGMTVEEIPYSCPYCESELTMEDSILSCPEHGVVYIG